jgi:hypothetical protein
MSEFHEFVATPKIMASISKIAQIKVMDLGNGMSGISATQISWGLPIESVIEFYLSLESHKLACASSKQWSKAFLDEVQKSKVPSDLDKSSACHLPHAICLYYIILDF